MPHLADPKVISASESKLHVEFDQRTLLVEADDGDWVHRLHIEDLNADIVPSESSHRLQAGKKLTVTLKKANAGSTWYSLKA